MNEELIRIPRPCMDMGMKTVFALLMILASLSGLEAKINRLLSKLQPRASACARAPARPFPIKLQMKLNWTPFKPRLSSLQK